ncbi:MAG: serine hydrolase domain-containing protein [Pirellulales bacterium]
MSVLFQVVFVSAWFALCSVAAAQAVAVPRNTLDADEAAAVDEAVVEQMREQGLVGVAVGLLHEGEIVYLKGYGFADRERRTPVTLDTVFNWASNSKPLCAVAAMQLVEQGKLDLDADVRRYVPEFPAHKGTITMRRLLSHQSGLPHYDGRVVAAAERNPRTRPLADPVFALDMFSASPLEFTPGAQTNYSSYAYILASAVVQRAGDEPFDRQIHRRIAEPLGMTSLTIDTAAAGQRHWAVGYEENDDGDMVRAPNLRTTGSMARGRTNRTSSTSRLGPRRARSQVAPRGNVARNVGSPTAGRRRTGRVWLGFHRRTPERLEGFAQRKTARGDEPASALPDGPPRHRRAHELRPRRAGRDHDGDLCGAGRMKRRDANAALGGSSVTLLPPRSSRRQTARPGR